jgi:hypothetical protein
MEYRLGQVIEMSHGQWKESYMCIFSSCWGEIHLKRCRLSKTKIGYVRFPEMIILRPGPNPAPISKKQGNGQ